MVTSTKGAQIQRKFFDELMGKLEEIEPGILSGL